MEEWEREEKLERLSELADTYVDAEMAKGQPFSEGLCNWAMDKALREIGGLR